MKKKNYILVLTFLCLLCGQMSYGFDTIEGGEDNFCFTCSSPNPLDEVIIVSEYKFPDSGDPCDPFSDMYDYDACYGGNNDSGNPCDFNSVAYDECICNPASCEEKDTSTKPQDPPSEPNLDEKALLVKLINDLCSETAKAQMAKAFDNNRLSKIEVRIVDKFIDNNLFGLHQVYDSNGILLEWDDTLNDFNGTPSYLPDGSYSRAVITIYRENISQSCTSDGCGNAQFHGINLTLEESIASTFSHELNHNTDLEFIIDLRNRREGKPSQNIDPHQNIKSQEKQVWNELNICN